MRISLLPHPADSFPPPLTAAEVEARGRALLGPEARIAAVQETGGGFNSAFVVEREGGPPVTLRISPPHGHPAIFCSEYYLLRREAALAPAFEQAVPGLLPRSLAADFTGDPDGRDAVLNATAEGDNWDAVAGSLDAAANTALWRELGALVRRIHDVRGSEHGWPAPEPGYPAWTGFVLHAARGLLYDFERLGLSHPEARAWLGAIEDGIKLLEAIREPRLVHADLRPGHVFIRREEGGPRISGLTGCEHGLWGDPEVEWAGGAAFPEPFWETYGPRPSGPEAEFRALAYAGLIEERRVLYAWRVGDDATEERRRLAGYIPRMRRLIVACGLS